MRRQSAERASRWNDRAPPSSAIRKKKNRKRKKKENIPAGSVASAGGLLQGREGRGGSSGTSPSPCLSVCLSGACLSVCLSVRLSASLASVRTSALPPLQRREASHPDDKNRKKTCLSLPVSLFLSFLLFLSTSLFLSSSLFPSLSLTLPQVRHCCSEADSSAPRQTSSRGLQLN